MQPTGEAGPSRLPRLHSSVESHLSTELALLHALRQRSKDQHKNQIFYRRISEILRLGKRVQDVLPSIRDSTQVQGATSSLLLKFTSALVKAANSTGPIIELRHFLPLQITLLGIYSRLFTIVHSVASAVGMDTQSLISGKRAKALKATVEAVGESSGHTPMDLNLDLGHRLERPAASTSHPQSVATSWSSRQVSQIGDTEDVSISKPSVVTSPEDRIEADIEITQPTRKRRSDDTRPAKSKKKRNVMDDIFG